MRNRHVAGAVIALAVAVLLAGCGGDDSDATATTTTTAAATAERLTTEQWASYETSRAAFQKANTAATAKLSVCSASPTVTAEQLQTCVGDAFTTLADATGDLGETLSGLTGTVSGACATALDAVLGYVIPYQASAQALQKTIDDGDLDAYTSASSNLKVAAASGAPKVTAFEKACAPG